MSVSVIGGGGPALNCLTSATKVSNYGALVLREVLTDF